MLRILRTPHRLPSLTGFRQHITRRTFSVMAATEESLTQEIAEQSAVVAKLKAEASDAAALEAEKKKLSELKKNLNLLKNAANGGKDAGKKKERLLLKTAKVRLA